MKTRRGCFVFFIDIYSLRSLLIVLVPKILKHYVQIIECTPKVNPFKQRGLKIWFNYDKLGLSQIVCENARLQNFPSHFRRNFHLEFNFFINPTVQGFHTVPKAKTNQNLSIKTKHVTAGADAAVHLQYTVCTSIIYLHILYIQYSRHSIQIF